MRGLSFIADSPERQLLKGIFCALLRRIAHKSKEKSAALLVAASASNLCDLHSLVVPPVLVEERFRPEDAFDSVKERMRKDGGELQCYLSRKFLASYTAPIRIGVDLAILGRQCL